MTIENIIYDATQAIRDFLATDAAKEVNGEQLGLDPNRALWRGWVTSEALIIEAQHDNRLRYYGGFEYVDASARQQVGDYVIYMREQDERVDGAISCAEEYFEDQE
jgi:hypothetical protein